MADLAVSGTAAVAVNRGAGMGGSTASIALRAVKKFGRSPQLIVMGSVQNALFLLIFRYVLGGAFSTSSIGGIQYVNFLVPGFVATAILFSGMMSAVGVAEDVEHGFFDRLKSLPIPRASVLAGRSIADTVLVAFGAAVAAAIGFAIGFRVNGGVAEAFGAFGLCALMGFAFEWMFISIGIAGGTAQGAQGMSMIVFPLAFVSSAYIPVNTMPGWLQSVAANQPVTQVVNAVRCLTEGPKIEALLHHSTGHYVVLSLIWCAGIVVVFSVLAVAQYSKR
jgi:ABC-2 type transport system permease protein